MDSTEDTGKAKKRHPGLQPLSRHHHHALVLAQMLINQRDALTTMQEKVLDFWERGGRAHFREEEEILLPEYARHHAIEDNPEIAQVLVEHVQLRSLVRQVTEKPTPENTQALGSLLRRHVRREEQVVFPMIEAGLPDKALRALEPYFAEHRTASVFQGAGTSDAADD